MFRHLAIRGDINDVINYPTKFHQFLKRSDIHVYDNKHAIVVCKDPEHSHWADLLATNLRKAGFDVAHFADDFMERTTVPKGVDWDYFWKVMEAKQSWGRLGRRRFRCGRRFFGRF